MILTRATSVVLTLLCGGLTFLPGAATADDARRVVIIGVPGLQWSDVTERRTPHIWRLTTSGGSAAMSTRGTPKGATCPIAGWLTVSAGQRAGTPAGEECGMPPGPGPGTGGTAPGFDELAGWNERRSPFRARIGALGQAVRDAGGKTMAIGPGALFAAADRKGRVDRYARDQATVRRLDTYRLIVADVDDLAIGLSAGHWRRAAAQEADRRIGLLLDSLPAGTDVFLAGVADVGPDRDLHVAVSSRHSGLLSSPSTKQRGMVTLADLAPAALDALGLEKPPGMGGRAWGESGYAPRAPVAELTEVERAAQVLGAVRFDFYVLLTGVQLLFFLLAALALRRRWGGDDARRRVLAATWVAAVFSGSIPAATFLSRLVPWWSAGPPLLALIGTVLVIAAAVSVAALTGPWRRHVLGPLTVVSMVTLAVLAADVMTSSHLQLDGLPGYSTVVGGRFHGFANLGWAAFATGTFLVLAAVSQPLLDQDRRRTALITAGIAGVAGAVIIGGPQWGANFGGTISWVAGMGIFLVMLAGLRLTIVRLAVACGLGALAIGLIAWLDWLRPRGDRTHLGEFLDTVLSGGALAVIGRKLDGAISTTLGNVPLALAAFVSLSFLYLVLRRPVSWRMSALSLTYEAAPALRPALFGLLTTALVGFAVNDSGVGIPAMMLTMGVPLVVAAALRAIEPVRRVGP